MEVIIAAVKTTGRALVKCAAEEDADILGVSCLSGAHLRIVEEILEARSIPNLPDLKIAVGGVIPERDISVLSSLGVDLVFSNGGATLDHIIARLSSLAKSATPRRTVLA